MLQILIWMLCVHLVLKGVELRLTAAASSHETRYNNMQTAKIWAFVAWCAAGIFFAMSFMQVSAMPSMPRVSPYPY